MAGNYHAKITLAGLCQMHRLIDEDAWVESAGPEEELADLVNLQLPEIGEAVARAFLEKVRALLPPGLRQNSLNGAASYGHSAPTDADWGGVPRAPA
jgi:hypothetical protein